MLKFELITPDARVTSQRVAMVTLPAEGGMLGVLPGHAPFASTLKPGFVKLQDASGKLIEMHFIAEGFVNVNKECCIILAEYVEESASLPNLVDIQDKIHLLEQKLAKDKDSKALQFQMKILKIKERLAA